MGRASRKKREKDVEKCCLNCLHWWKLEAADFAGLTVEEVHFLSEYGGCLKHIAVLDKLKCEPFTLNRDFCEDFCLKGEDVCQPSVKDCTSELEFHCHVRKHVKRREIAALVRLSHLEGLGKSQFCWFADSTERSIVFDQPWSCPAPKKPEFKTVMLLGKKGHAVINLDDISQDRFSKNDPEPVDADLMEHFTKVAKYMWKMGIEMRIIAHGHLDLDDDERGGNC